MLLMVINPYLLVQFCMFLLVVMIIIQHQHFLMILLLLEVSVLCLVLFGGLMINKGLLFYFMMILTFGAIEASLGLCILVLIARAYGSDLLKMSDLMTL